jgi:hypothetical protein
MKPTSMKISLMNILMELPSEERELLVDELRQVVQMVSRENGEGKLAPSWLFKARRNRFSNPGKN